MTRQSTLRTTPVHPNDGSWPSRLVTDRYGLWERSRLEWRLGEPGDPAVLATEFLAEHGLGLPSRTHRDNDPTQRDDVVAQLYLSAAAGAWMIGGAVGAPSPTPSIPDLVVIVYSRSVTENRLIVPPPPALADWSVDVWNDTWTPQQHAQAVERVRAAIAWGEVYQVNVVGHSSARYTGDPMPALHRLTQLPGAAFGGILAGDGWALASASPELLVRVEGDQVETRPIKGTRPATEEGRRELLASTKERAEHIMIVDLERNDLAHIARTGSVMVPELFAVRRWCDLWQAESRVVATLADGMTLADLLRAICPGGSVTGAPKLAALAHIAALEPVGRGVSMGALGWLDRRGLTLGLTIRTAAVDAQRVHLWAGGGIIWDADPWAEVAEAAAKAAPLRATLAGRPTGTAR